MSQNSKLDSVIEKLERYCNYLQKEVNKNNVLTKSGVSSNQDILAADDGTGSTNED